MSNSQVFIIGSGFSKEYSPEMVTLKELSQQVWKKQSDIPEKLDDMKSVGYKDDIEMLMNFLVTDQPWIPTHKYHENLSLFYRLADWVGNTIEDNEKNAFEGREENPSWMQNFLMYIQEKKIPVITLNYDTIIENALEIQKRTTSYQPVNGKTELPCSWELYPNPINYSMTRARYSNDKSIHDNYSNADPFPYFKLHGSINWYYNQSRSTSNNEIYYTDVMKIRGASSSQEEMVQEKSKFIVPPVSEKSQFFENDILELIWSNAIDHLKEADRVFMLGYSFPKSDLTMRHFLNTAFKGREPKDTVEVYPVNYSKKDEVEGDSTGNHSKKDREEDVTDRLQEYLSKNVFQIDDKYMVPEEDKEDPIPKFVNAYIRD